MPIRKALIIKLSSGENRIFGFSIWNSDVSLWKFADVLNVLVRVKQFCSGRSSFDPVVLNTQAKIVLDNRGW